MTLEADGDDHDKAVSQGRGKNLCNRDQMDVEGSARPVVRLQSHGTREEAKCEWEKIETRIQA